MPVITLRYDVDLGLKRALDNYPAVAAVPLERGELELLGMETIGDMVQVTGSTTVARIVTLATEAQAEQSFPTAATLSSATEKLYRSVLNLGLPARVTAVTPLVEEFTPLDVESAALAFWWRADIGVLFDQVTNDVSQWDDVVAGVELLPSPTEPGHLFEDANMGGKQDVFYGGGSWFDANLVASEFNFLHDGSGMSVFLAARPTSNDPAQDYLSTAELATTNRGINVWYDGAARIWTLEIGNGAALIANVPTAAVATPNTRQYLSARYLEGRPGNEFAFRCNSSNVTGNTGAAPSAGNAEAPLRIGASAVTAAQPIVSGWTPEIAIYTGFVSDEETARLHDEYFPTRYGAAGA